MRESVRCQRLRISNSKCSHQTNGAQRERSSNSRDLGRTANLVRETEHRRHRVVGADWLAVGVKRSLSRASDGCRFGDAGFVDDRLRMLRDVL